MSSRKRAAQDTGDAQDAAHASQATTANKWTAALAGTYVLMQTLFAFVVRGVRRDAELSKFLTNLLEAEEHDGFLKLKNPCRFPGSPGSSTKRCKLLVTDGYVKMYDFFKNMKTACLVAGTPGIGKTWMAIYFIWRILKESKDTVIIWEYSSARYKFHDKQVYVGALNSFQQELNDPKTRYILDGKVHTGISIRAKVLVIMSAGTTIHSDRVEHWRRTQNASLRVLPPPTTHEVCKLYQEVYSGEISAARFCRLLRVYGPVFRSTLESPSILPEVCDFVSARMALYSCKLDKILSSLMRLGGIPEHGNELLLLIPDDQFRPKHVRFASLWMMQEFNRLIVQEDRSRLGTLLSHLSNAYPDSMRSVLYKCAMHEILSSEFAMPLEAAEGQEMQSSSAYGVTVDATHKELHLAPCTACASFERPNLRSTVTTWRSGGMLNRYLMPYVVNYPYIDSIRPGNTLFKTTILQHKKVDWAKLEAILLDMDPGNLEPFYLLIFVVPDTSNFTVDLSGRDGNKESRRVHKVRVYKAQVADTYIKTGTAQGRKGNAYDSLYDADMIINEDEADNNADADDEGRAYGPAASSAGSAGIHNAQTTTEVHGNSVGQLQPTAKRQRKQ